MAAGRKGFMGLTRFGGVTPARSQPSQTFLRYTDRVTIDEGELRRVAAGGQRRRGPAWSCRSPRSSRTSASGWRRAKAPRRSRSSTPSDLYLACACLHTERGGVARAGAPSPPAGAVVRGTHRPLALVRRRREAAPRREADEGRRPGQENLRSTQVAGPSARGCGWPRSARPRTASGGASARSTRTTSRWRPPITIRRCSY